MVLYNGDWSVFVQRQISLGFLLLAGCTAAGGCAENIRRSREQAFLE